MRMAFVGHSHHQVTGSSRFMVDLLGRAGDVSTFWDDSWISGNEFDPSPVVEGGFDAVVVWQVEAVAARLARAGLHNLTFFPMYDGCHAMPDAYWASLQPLKVVCFCSALHHRLQRLGLRSRYVQYFPDPASLPQRNHRGELDGYFWQRQQDVTWATVRRLLGDAPFHRLTLNRALDPSFGAFAMPTREELSRFGIRFTAWNPDKRAALDDLATHAVYFAPRIREGIGLSFLEAMAMGMLVVAPDQPTMNEYLVHGVNGLLYDPSHPAPLDFSRPTALGNRARQTVELGHAKWLRCAGPLLDFVAEPAASTPVHACFDSFDPRHASHALPAPAAKPGPATGASEGGLRLRPDYEALAPPLVTVAVVTRNAEATLCGTLESILEQDLAEKEVIVLDGASSDGTVGMLRDFDDRLDWWRSAPDGGPYEAMNAAVGVARGTYLIFMNAGDRFHGGDSLSRAFAAAPRSADVIFGHHVYRNVSGLEEIHLAAAFEETWRKLREGEVGWGWLARVPGHQSTLTSTELLRRIPYRTELRIAADHDFLYRAAARGAVFHHSCQVLSTYVGGGISWKNQELCFKEWRQIALEHTEHPAQVKLVFERMEEDLKREAVGQMSLSQLLRRASRDASARNILATNLKRRFKRLVPRPLRAVQRVRVEFGGPDLGAAVASFAGLSTDEGWGRWTEGRHVQLKLTAPVKRPAKVFVRIKMAFGPNVGKVLAVRIGTRTFRHLLRPGEQTFLARFGRTDKEPVERIELEIPEPASPARLGINGDERLLGIALRSAEIRARRL